MKVISRVIDWIAELASQTLRATGRMTVVVQDNGSLYTSHKTCQQLQRWRSQGLFLFFLPPYCCEMTGLKSNGINSKPMKLRSRMFEDEYDLALAIMDGMEARNVKGGYTLNYY